MGDQTLRQYAFVANTIRNVFNAPAKNDYNGKETQTHNPGQLSELKFSGLPGKPGEKNGVIVLSNNDPNESKLDWLLRGSNQTAGLVNTKAKVPQTPADSVEDTFTPEDEVKVDVTLRTQLGQPPVIMLLFAVDDTRPEAPMSPIGRPVLRKVSVSLEVGVNGRISVVDMAGLLDDETGGDGMDTQGPDGPKSEAAELQSKIARVFEVSQDIGILVEWILRWLRQRNGR